VKKELKVLNSHNVFMSAMSRTQAEASWAILRDNRGDVQPDAPFNFYVHRPSQTDPSAAPEGCDSIMVLVPCRTLIREEEYSKMPRDQALALYKDQFSESVIDQAREAVLTRMGALESLQDLEELILDEVVDTPATWAEQFHVGAGTPFAMVSNLLVDFSFRFK
jgi:phytoene desaturase (3,4-didehydrolycopene-forming)